MGTDSGIDGNCTDYPLSHFAYYYKNVYLRHALWGGYTFLRLRQIRS